MKKNKIFGFVLYTVSLTGLYFFLNYILQIDSLLSYKNQEGKNSQAVSIELKNAIICTYKKDFMASRIEVDCFQVTKDKDQLLLHSIRNGALYSRGSMVGFAARKGIWYRNRKKLIADHGVRVKNKYLNFITSHVEFNESNKNLYVPGKIRGEFFKGELEAENLLYNSEQNSFKIGQTEWVGNIDDIQNPIKKKKEEFTKPQFLTPPKVELPSSKLVSKPSQEDVKRKKWTIKAKSGTRPPGDIEIWNQAEATDGEIIIMANKLERNVKTDIIIATENVRYYGEEVNMTCKKAMIYRNEKRALLEGSVNAYIKPKEENKLEVIELEPLQPLVPDEILSQRPLPPKKDSIDKKLDDEVHSTKSKRKYPTTVIADSVEYWYKKGERKANIKGNLQGRQELAEGRWRHVWAYSAHFDKEKEQLKLMSRPHKKDVRVKTSLGDNLLAIWFELSTDEKKESWQGEGIEGDVIVDQEES